MLQRVVVCHHTDPPTHTTSTSRLFHFHWWRCTVRLSLSLETLYYSVILQNRICMLVITVGIITLTFISVNPLNEAIPVIAEVLLIIATCRHARTVKLADDAHANVPLTKVLIRDGQ